MRVGRGDAERLRVSRPPPHPPQCEHWGTFPPVGGRLWACSNREGFCLLWDVWIHILGIRPYGFPETVLKLGRGTPWCSLRRHAPGSQRAGEGTRPYGVFTNGSTYRKRDRSGTCLLKHGGEAELRRKFFWFLFFQEKELLTFFFKESRQLGKVLYEMQENFAEISTFLTGGTVAKAGRLW